MNIFDNFIIPESAASLNLLNYILTLSLVLFLPYIGFINGAAIYSVIFNILGRKKRDHHYLQYSHELVEMAFFKKGILFALGVIPFTSILFSYAQLLYKADVHVVSYLVLSLILLIISFTLIYTYKYTFRLDNLFSSKILPEIKSEPYIVNPEDETTKFIASNLKVHKISGSIGIILLIISTYLIIGSIQLSTDRLIWSESSFLKMIFSIKTFFKFILFISASFAITSGAVLYFFLKWRGNYEYKEINYIDFVKRFNLITGIIFTFILPVLLLLNLLFTPKLALTNSLFGYSLFAIIVLFVLIHFIYIMIKNSEVKFIPHSFYALLLVFILFIIGDQSAFGTANQKQLVTLAANYDRVHQQMMEKLGTVTGRSGDEIFQGQCSACHKFESRLVGPAYNEVLQKYEGKIEDLASFILNPVKVNPNFPPMPNPGLKPNEAKAVAEYIMNTYKK